MTGRDAVTQNHFISFLKDDNINLTVFLDLQDGGGCSL